MDRRGAEERGGIGRQEEVRPHIGWCGSDAGSLHEPCERGDGAGDHEREEEPSVGSNTREAGGLTACPRGAKVSPHRRPLEHVPEHDRQSRRVVDDDREAENLRTGDVGKRLRDVGVLHGSAGEVEVPPAEGRPHAKRGDERAHADLCHKESVDGADETADGDREHEDHGHGKAVGGRPGGEDGTHSKDAADGEVKLAGDERDHHGERQQRRDRLAAEDELQVRGRGERDRERDAEGHDQQQEEDDHAAVDGNARGQGSKTRSL